MPLFDPEHYIIDTKTISCPNGRQVEYRDLLKNEEYARWAQLEKDRKLNKEKEFMMEDRRVNAVASNFHNVRHITEETMVAKTDDEGLIFIEDEALAKKFLETMQTVDKDIRLSKYGKQFDVPVGIPPALR